MKTKCKRKKTNYDRSSDHFDDPSLMALVFLDRYLMVYKPVNARGARSLNVFLDFLICNRLFRNETGNGNNG